MESNPPPYGKKLPFTSKGISCKSNKSLKNSSGYDVQKNLKTPSKHKEKRNVHKKFENSVTEVKNTHSVAKKYLTSSPANVAATSLDDEHLQRSLHHEGSLMSLDVSFQSQEEDNNAELTEVSFMQSSCGDKQQSTLEMSDLNSTGALDDTFLGIESAVKIQEHLSSENECDLTFDCQKTTPPLSSCGNLKNMSFPPPTPRSSNLGSNHAFTLAASLMSRSPTSLSEIPFPPSPQRVVHIESFSRANQNSVLSAHGKMTSPILNPDEEKKVVQTLNISQENKSLCSRQKMSLSKKEMLFKSSIEKVVNPMAMHSNKSNTISTTFRSHPKKRLSLSPSFAYPVKQFSQQSGTNVARTIKVPQNKLLTSSKGFVEVSENSDVQSLKIKNCSTNSQCSMTVKSPQGSPLCLVKTDSSCSPNANNSRHVNATATSLFSMKHFFEKRKSLGAKSDCSVGELDYSCDKLSDLSSETTSHTPNGSLHDSSLLVEKLYSVGFIDTHCHLDFLFKKTHHQGTLSDYMSKMRNTENDLLKFPASYEGCVAVFCQPDTFIKTMWYKRLLTDEAVWGAFGCHPHFSSNFGALELLYLKKALEHPKVIALGEIGLDYSHKNSVDISTQQTVFKIQLAVAVEKKLPIVIHSRDAHSDTLRIMKQSVPLNTKMHRHCFTETWREAVEWLETFPNCFIGFTNLVSQRCNRGRRLTDVVRRMPLDRLLLETDSPYFAPECVRTEGVYNAHPGHALYVAAEVARVKGLSVDEVLLATRRNTTAVYGI